MRLLDADDPFFKPVWRRWVTVLLPLLWGAFELGMGGSGWGVLFVAAGVYAFWVLIVKGPKGSE